MACLSDIDLATLHENRLEQRWHYGLPNSDHQYHQHLHHHHHHDGFSPITRLCLERNLQKKLHQRDLNGNCLDSSTDGSGPAAGMQRRRSGTWP